MCGGKEKTIKSLNISFRENGEQLYTSADLFVFNSVLHFVTKWKVLCFSDITWFSPFPFIKENLAMYLFNFYQFITELFS
jgi:hypothetical protein